MTVYSVPSVPSPADMPYKHPGGPGEADEEPALPLQRHAHPQPPLQDQRKELFD